MSGKIINTRGACARARVYAWGRKGVGLFWGREGRVCFPSVSVIHPFNKWDFLAGFGVITFLQIHSHNLNLKSPATVQQRESSIVSF